MLAHWLQTYLLMLMEARSTRRDRQIQFLKLQIELLRGKLPVSRHACRRDPRLFIVDIRVQRHAA